MEKNNINVKLVLHQEINKFRDKITSNSKRIQIYRNGNVDYSQLLLNCIMLITDFSSVFFDVAYMKKPVVYFQFDKKEFRKKHLQEGYFSYEKDGFGEIFENENDVVNKIIEYKNNNFRMEEKYLQRVENFFEKRDSSNCERIVEAILSIKK